MSDNSSAPTTQLITRTHRVPLSDCKTIVDFFKGMYDILEAHRWAVTEHKFLHHDISSSNIIVEVQDTPNIQEFSNTKRPIFINEVLHGKLAPPIARLLDMDNGANLDTSKVKLRRGTASDEPLRNHTCTSTKFVARSVAARRILDDTYFLPMPTLTSDIAAKYKQAYHADSSELRTFSDADGSTHGGRPDHEGLVRFHTDPDVEMLDHQPFHGAESVFRCIAPFVLLAKPLKNDPDENRDALNKMCTCLAEQEGGSDNDTRYHFFERDKWTRWVHKDLAFIACLMASLSLQVTPDWALLTPAPDPLHLHEAMQRLILQHVHIWETKGVNVELRTSASRRMPGKRGSNSIEGQTQSASKRLRKTGNNEKYALKDTSG